MTYGLPPHQDTLHTHIQRASTQAAVHRRSLECYPDIPPPINHGWKMAGELYEVDWMSLPPAPIQFNSIQFYLYSAITIQLSLGALQSPEPETPLVQAQWQHWQEKTPRSEEHTSEL